MYQKDYKSRTDTLRLLWSRVFAACFLFQLRDRAKEASPTRDFWTESGRRKNEFKDNRAVGRHDKPSTEPEHFFELAERLERFDKSVGAPPGCLHTQDTHRQADLSMIKAAQKMYNKLVGKGECSSERYDVTAV